MSATIHAKEVVLLRRIMRSATGITIGAGAVATIDSGLGLLKSGTSDPKIVRIERQAGAPNRAIVIFHGYNGHGEALARILGPVLSAYGTVVGFEPTGDRYDNEKVLDAADWLRRHPSLLLKAWVLNASPSGLKDALGAGSWAKVFDWLYGGPISSTLLQLAQRHGMRNLPPIEPDADAEAAELAYKLALQITAPMIFGEVSYIRGFTPPRSGEFAGRVEQARYIHAPAPRGHDGRIKVAAASQEWRKALSDAHFQDVTVGSWEKETHTPTAERPSGLLRELIAVMK